MPSARGIERTLEPHRRRRAALAPRRRARGVCTRSGSDLTFLCGDCSALFRCLSAGSCDGVRANSGGPIFAGALLGGDERFAFTSWPALSRWRRDFRAGRDRWVWWRCGPPDATPPSASAAPGLVVRSRGWIFARGLHQDNRSYASRAARAAGDRCPEQIRWGKSSASRYRKVWQGIERFSTRRLAVGPVQVDGSFAATDELEAATDRVRGARARQDGGASAAWSSRPIREAKGSRSRSTVQPRVRFGGHGSPARTSTPRTQERSLFVRTICRFS